VKLEIGFPNNGVFIRELKGFVHCRQCPGPSFCHIVVPSDSSNAI